jgi:hypothetical protein
VGARIRSDQGVSALCSILISGVLASLPDLAALKGQHDDRLAA